MGGRLTLEPLTTLDPVPSLAEICATPAWSGINVLGPPGALPQAIKLRPSRARNGAGAVKLTRAASSQTAPAGTSLMYW